MGWCASTISAAASPYAVVQKLGWFGERGVKVIVTALPGSTDCVKEVATGDLPFSVPSIEPVLIIHPQGVKAKIFKRRIRVLAMASPCRLTAGSRILSI